MLGEAFNVDAVVGHQSVQLLVMSTTAVTFPMAMMSHQ